MAKIPDIEQSAQRVRDHIRNQSASHGPGAVLLTVVDGSGQLINGYVWCTHGDKTVQCIAPATVGDLRTATVTSNMIIWALPPNPDEPGGFYLAVGFAQNGGTVGSYGPGRVPPLMGTTVNDPNGNPITGGGTGTVTSVALAMPSPFSVAGSPITTAGTLTVTQPSAFVETQGGTGQSTYTQGDILYASAANTLSKLAIGTAGFVLKVVAGIPAWTQLFYQTLKKAGSGVTQRSAINFVDSATITVTLIDDSGNDQTTVTIDSVTDDTIAWFGMFI